MQRKRLIEVVVLGFLCTCIGGVVGVTQFDEQGDSVESYEVEYLQDLSGVIDIETPEVSFNVNSPLLHFPEPETAVAQMDGTLVVMREFRVYTNE